MIQEFFEFGRRPKALVYILHCGNLYGTERMALATMAGLDGYDKRVVMAPRVTHGDTVADAAVAAKLDYLAFDTSVRLALSLASLMLRHRALDVISTSVTQSFICHVLARTMFVRIRQIHVVHGGTDDAHAYKRKRILNWLPVRIVAVSRFVRDRLINNGVRSDSVAVIDNFLIEPSEQLIPQRASYEEQPIDRDCVRVAVVSRIDAIKRIDLLLEAVEGGTLGNFEFDIYGTGSELDNLRHRSLSLSNVRMHGYVSDVPARMSRSDLLLHLCPEEPFGLVLLEAFRGGLVTLVPDRGGAAEVVIGGQTGYHFQANDPADLVRKLHRVRDLPPTALSRVSMDAKISLDRRFSAREGARHYREALAVASSR